MKTTRRAAMYLSAAIPAVYLPLAYLALVVHVLVAVVSRTDVAVAKHSALWHFGTVAIALTFVQWPAYFAWVGLSRELSFRQKAAWWIVIVVGNMFAMPYFLWCKYRRKTVEGLLSIMGRRRIGNYLARRGQELACHVHGTAHRRP